MHIVFIFTYTAPTFRCKETLPADHPNSIPTQFFVFEETREDAISLIKEKLMGYYFIFSEDDWKIEARKVFKGQYFFVNAPK